MPLGVRFILDGMHERAYLGMWMADDVEWDGRKAAANLKKLGVDFADVATVLHDDEAITIRADEVGEERYVTIGMDALARPGRGLHVAWRAITPDIRAASDAEETQEYEGKP
jgi:uncharacterized DUF497 family protein